MCKAFVKLPRPFGDQSGGARKWAIRAGCESWFSGGGYHPPGSSPLITGRGKQGGKAKATARAKQLAIGTSSPPVDKPKQSFEESPWSPGPSAGPAFDGSGRPFYPFPQPTLPPYGLQPGFHYIPVSHPMHPYTQHMHGHGSSMYIPAYQYQAPPPPSSSSHTPPSAPGGIYDRPLEPDISTSSASPDGRWREEGHSNQNNQSGPSEHGSHASWDDNRLSPLSIHATLSPHTTSPPPTR